MVPTRRGTLRTLGTVALAATVGCIGQQSFAANCTEGELTAGDATLETVSGAWPEFAYDPANTGYAPDLTGPTDPAIAWRYASCDPPMGEAAPTVADGTLYVANSQRPSVYALDADGSATAPVVTDDTVFVAGRDILAIDRADGSVRWRQGRGLAPDSASASSATVVDGVVYASGGLRDPTLYAVDARSGDVLWTATTGGDELRSSPAVADGRVYVTSDAGRLLSVDAATGGDARVLAGETNDLRGTPVVAGGTVYATLPNGSVVALTLDGTRRWTTSVGTTGVDGPPVVAEDAVHVAGGGVLWTLDPSDGSERWQIPLAESLGTPVRAGGTIYVGVRDGSRRGEERAVGAIHGVDAIDGSERFRVTTREIPAGEGGPYAGTTAPVAVAEGCVFASTFAGDVVALA